MHKTKFANRIYALNKELVALYLAKVISAHYKHCGNANFLTFNHYCNLLLVNASKRQELYEDVDRVMLKKYQLFFAHLQLDTPIFIVDLTVPLDKQSY